jgi:hypothetical protein
MRLGKGMRAASPEPAFPDKFDRSFWTARHYYKPCFRHNLTGVTCPFLTGIFTLQQVFVEDCNHASAAAEYRSQVSTYLMHQWLERFESICWEFEGWGQAQDISFALRVPAGCA